MDLSTLNHSQVMRPITELASPFPNVHTTTKENLGLTCISSSMALGFEPPVCDHNYSATVANKNCFEKFSKENLLFNNSNGSLEQTCGVLCLPHYHIWNFKSCTIVKTCKPSSRGNANEYQCSAPIQGRSRLSPANIKAELDSTLGKSAPSFTTVKYWVAEFKRGRMSCQDKHHSGRPNEQIGTG
ncbi:mariner transposase [Trichonephila clavipes]|nr:mariner transposase [Trichonephila clavipes]